MDNTINLKSLFSSALFVISLFLLLATVAPTVHAATIASYGPSQAPIQLAWYHRDRVYRVGPRYHYRAVRVVPRCSRQCFVNARGFTHCVRRCH